jgi:hypothetical protein
VQDARCFPGFTSIAVMVANETDSFCPVSLGHTVPSITAFAARAYTHDATVSAPLKSQWKH